MVRERHLGVRRRVRFEGRQARFDRDKNRGGVVVGAFRWVGHLARILSRERASSEDRDSTGGGGDEKLGR